jgi:Malonate decarboxylase, alpha subunit, transporter
MSAQQRIQMRARRRSVRRQAGSRSRPSSFASSCPSFRQKLHVFLAGLSGRFGNRFGVSLARRLSRQERVDIVMAALRDAVGQQDQRQDCGDRHIVSEEGIANLLLCRTAEEREQAIRGIAGFTDVGRRRDRKMVEKLRERKVIRRPEDLGINPLDAHRSMLAARSIEDLMHWSGNLYDPPNKFRNW